VSAFRNFCLYMRRNVSFKNSRPMRSTLTISLSTNCYFQRHVRSFPRLSFHYIDLLQPRIVSTATCAKKCNKNILQRLTNFMTSFSTLSGFLCSQRRSEAQRNSKNLARCWLNHTCPLAISLDSNEQPYYNATLHSAQLFAHIVPAVECLE
jgi:hypothetical protein